MSPHPQAIQTFLLERLVEQGGSLAEIASGTPPSRACTPKTDRNGGAPPARPSTIAEADASAVLAPGSTLAVRTPRAR
jgi:hypothetical protein